MRFQSSFSRFSAEFRWFFGSRVSAKFRPSFGKSRVSAEFPPSFGRVSDFFWHCKIWDFKIAYCTGASFWRSCKIWNFKISYLAGSSLSRLDCTSRPVGNLTETRPKLGRNSTETRPKLGRNSAETRQIPTKKSPTQIITAVPKLFGNYSETTIFEQAGLYLSAGWKSDRNSAETRPKLDRNSTETSF